MFEMKDGSFAVFDAAPELVLLRLRADGVVSLLRDDDGAFMLTLFPDGHSETHPDYSPDAAAAAFMEALARMSQAWRRGAEALG